MAARQAASTRADSSSKTSLPPTQIPSNALVHSTASFKGQFDINVGPKAIIQLRSRIDSTYAPVRLGAGCIIYERASIGYLSRPSHVADGGVTIGDGVIIESGAVIEATSIGSHTTIEAHCRIGKEAVIGAYCKVCSGVEVGEKAVLTEGTLVWGSGWDQRRVESDVQKDNVHSTRRQLADGLNAGIRAIWSPK